MKRFLAFLLLVAATAAAQNTPPEVVHIWAQQRPGAQIVDVNYSAIDPDFDELTISLYLLARNGAVILQCASVTGDVGAGIQPGANKYITWDAGADFPGQYGSDYTLRVVANDGAGIDGFVSIPPGTFIMGSPIGELGRYPYEIEHQVTLTHGFYMQTTEVTNQQYMEMAQWAYNQGYVTATITSLRDNLDGSTQELLNLDEVYCEISFSGGAFTVDVGKEDYPVLDVSWYGSVAYCDWLSLQQGLPRAYNHGTWQCNGGDPYTAAGYRLSTEAVCEYACRAGSTTAFANGPITYTACSPLDPNLDAMGWYCGNAGTWLHPVAQKTPNAWGLYDMHGNLYEWCNDWHAAYGGTVTDPTGPGAGTYRVIRGGDWCFDARYCRSASRCSTVPGYSDYSIGFRSVRSSD